MTDKINYENARYLSKEDFEKDQTIQEFVQEAIQEKLEK